MGVSTGCGGDTLSRQEYVSELNAMCRDFATREQAIGDPKTVADLIEKGPRVLEAFEAAIVAKVHDLEAPEEIAGEASRIAELADRQRDVLAGLVDAAKASDFARLRQLASENDAVNRDAGAIAGKLGAEDCADPGALD